jgi:SAM-dependent methyltransferase
MVTTSEYQHQISEYYRQVMDGHVYIRDTIDALLDMLGERIRHLGRPPSILELGCHAGVPTEWILERWPNAEITVQDEREELIEMARERLANKRVAYHAGPVETLGRKFDFVVSIARHHHLPHDYLEGVRGVLAPGGVYLLAEELCPEYCAGEHAQRIARADVLHIIGGYVLTSQADVAAYETDGTIPTYALELEQLRRRALWRWYRFVVDYAVDRECYDIAVAELQSAHDDLITGSAAEHKFSPSIVDRQFALAGFRQLSKREVGPADDPELQSMGAFEYALA